MIEGSNNVRKEAKKRPAFKQKSSRVQKDIISFVPAASQRFNSMLNNYDIESIITERDGASKNPSPARQDSFKGFKTKVRIRAESNGRNAVSAMTDYDDRAKMGQQAQQLQPL